MNSQKKYITDPLGSPQIEYSIAPNYAKMYQNRRRPRGFVPDLGKWAPGLAVFAEIDPYKEY